VARDQLLIGGWLWRPLLGASLLQVTLFMVRPAMSYSVLAFGGGPLEIGWITALYALVPMFVAIAFGRIAGRLAHIGAVPAAAAALVAVACVVCAVATDEIVLGVASVLLGVGMIAAIIGGQTWISRSAPAHRYDDGFGWMTAGMSFGQALGPVLMGLLIGSAGGSGTTNATGPYWAGAGIAVLALVVFATRGVRAYSDSEGPTPRTATSVEILRIPLVLRYIFASAAVLTTIDLVGAYLPTVGEAADIAPGVVGALLAVRALASMGSRLLLGRMTRRWPRPGLTAVSTAIAAASMLVVALVPVVPALVPAMIVGGFFLGIVQPLTIASVAQLVPERARSSALAIRLLGNRVVQVALPLLAGGVSTVGGVAGIFVMQTTLLAVAAAWVGWRGPSATTATPPDDAAPDSDASGQERSADSHFS